jgi:hypothetical protein
MTDSTVQSTKSAISSAARTTTLPKLRFHEDLLIAPREFANSVRMGEDIDYRTMLYRVRNVGETIARGESYGYDSEVIHDVLISEPARIVNAELRMGCSWREYQERVAEKFGISVRS